MRTTLALVALALAVPAHGASADEPAYGCTVRSVQQEAATGSEPTLIGLGWAVHADAVVTITCSITVNGVETSRTPTGIGYTLAATAGQLHVVADPERDSVAVCATATVAGHPPVTYCYDAGTSPVPPRPVTELVDAAFDLVFTPVDAALCPVLGGDVYVADVFVWDCPPYGS